MLVKKWRVHRAKVSLVIVGLGIIWLVLRYFFPFEISKAAEESAIRELFATAEITHIRIIYACCGNEAPVEAPEVDFQSLEAADQAEMRRIFHKMQMKRQHTKGKNDVFPWDMQEMPTIELRLTSTSYGSVKMIMRQALHIIQIGRPMSVMTPYEVRGDFYDFQTAVCNATQRSGVHFEPRMSRKSFEHNKEVFEEICGRSCVEATYLIRLPPSDEAPPTKAEVDPKFGPESK